MPWVGFEPTIPASERSKTVHALERSATVTGLIKFTQTKIWLTYKEKARSEWSKYLCGKSILLCLEVWKLKEMVSWIKHWFSVQNCFDRQNVDTTHHPSYLAVTHDVLILFCAHRNLRKEKFFYHRFLSAYPKCTSAPLELESSLLF
jgi:hypothetical protein